MIARRVLSLMAVFVLILAGSVLRAGTFMPTAVVDQTPTAPLASPVPGSAAPRYISGFGLDDNFTVFFEDRDASFQILHNSTTGGPSGFAASNTSTNITDTHFLIKNWPINIGGTDYAYRAWGAVGNNLDHNFYVSNDLSTWTTVSTFQIPNDPGFTTARGCVYYGFHDVILINGTYYAFGESNCSETFLVRSANGDDVWEAFAGVGGQLSGDGPLQLPTGISAGWTPTGDFIDLGYDRGYGKVYAHPGDAGFYLAINTAAKASLSPAALEAAFINPANWTWHDDTTGPAANMILPATAEHDLRECWVVPNSDPDDDWVIIYDGDFGLADGGKALGYATLTPPPLPPVHNVTKGTYYSTIQTAINDADPGDRIDVAAGTYNERLNISKSLDLRGAQYGVDPTPAGARTNPAVESVVDIAGLGVTNPNVLVEIPSGVTNVSVSGFMMNGSLVSHYADEATVRCWDDNLTFRDNIIDGYFGVLWKGNDYLTIDRNRITANKVGVTVQPNPATYAAISGNKILPGTSPASDAAGIYITGDSYTSITGNTVTGFVNSNGVGGSNHYIASISGNTFTGNKKGVNFWGNTTFITITNNNISNSANHGIDIKGADITISNNLIANSGGSGVRIALDAIPTQRVTVSGNSITGNTVENLLVDTGVTETVNASGNWWGDYAPASVTDKISGPADYTPWLHYGTNLGGSPGFQPTLSYLHVDDTSPQTGTAGRIQEGIDLVTGSTVYVHDGLYQETLNIASRSNVVVQGESQAGTIYKPSATQSWAIPGYPQYDSRLAAIRVYSSTDIDFKSMTMDFDLVKGNNVVGVFYWNATGEISGNLIQNMTLPDAGGGYSEITSYFRAPDYTDAARAQIDILNNTFLKTGRLGICTHNFVNALIEDNVFDKVDDDFGYAMEIGSASTATVRGNTIRNYDTWAASDHSNSAAIYVENSFTGGMGPIAKPVVIEDNEIYNCQHGIYAGNEWAGYAGNVDIDLTIRNNSIHDNSTAAPEASGGIVLVDEGKDVGSSLAAEVSGNTIAGNGNYGVYCYTYGNGDLDVAFANNIITGHGDGIKVEDFGSPSTSSYVLGAAQNNISGNTGFGINNLITTSFSALTNWWGDASGPYHATLNPAGAGNDVSDYVLFDPWIGKAGGENIVCDPDPQYLTNTVPTNTVAVKYLGGGGGLVYGYSVSLSWDASKVTMGGVTQGSLLSGQGTTYFFVSGTGNSRTVDCVLAGNYPGVTGPGTMFTVSFTGTALGTSPVNVTVNKVRDKNNVALGGFYEDDGLLVIDLSNPVVSGTFIENVTLTHTDDYIKDTDAAKVTATVTDDDPAFGIGNIKADLTELGGGGSVAPDSYVGGVATWNLASVVCNPANGTVTVTVTATDAIGNVGTGSDTIIADNEAPGAATSLAAVQQKSGNDGDGTTKITLTYTAPGDAWSVEVYRAGFGNYPEYDDPPGGGVPAAPSYVPGSPWALTGVVASGQKDEPTARDYWYYVAFVKDIAWNVSAVSNKTGGTLNYHLGDVAPGGTGDNLVNTVDFSALGGTYWLSEGAGSYLNYCDVGPTTDYSTNGRPTTDNVVDFEDLMMFAINFTTVSLLAGNVAPFEAPQVGLVVDEVAGDVLRAHLALSGNRQSVKGLHSAVSYDPASLELVRVSRGGLVTSQPTQVFFEDQVSGGEAQVDLAVMGSGLTIRGSGEVAVLEFRVVSSDVTLPVLAAADLRDRNNKALSLTVNPGRMDDRVSASAKALTFGAYPNPFRGETAIVLSVPVAGEVTLRVYDVSGREVATLVDGEMEAGSHRIAWDGRGASGSKAAPGVYLAVVRMSGKEMTGKLFMLP